MADIKEGDRVRILVGSPEGTPVDGTVRVVQDTPGKKVGVELDHYVAGGHSLDNKLDEKEKTDTNTGVTYGKGWWTLDEDVEVL